MDAQADTIQKGTIGGGAPIGDTTFTMLTGCPVAHMKNSLTAGPMGPVCLQDTVLLEKVKQFNREKIPARNVHALGTGCYGKLTITNDITRYSCAKVFSEVGKETQLFARMSGIFTEQGDPTTNRDPRGFAMKFYTEEGNWDLLTINTPVFNVRDMKNGPDVVHCLKRDPRTAEYNPTQSWDYFNWHPEGLHQTLMLYSDRGGTPMSFRHMHSWGANTFSFINAQKERFWVRFHLISHLGAKGLNQIQAKLVAGEDPNLLGRDLRQAIERGDFPKWRFCFQVMPEEEGYTKSFAFDCTKAWKHADYPLIEIGEVELNKNIIDYFTEVEQVAFSPATVPPGIGYSPDKLLQGRLLVYDDTQHHRLGPNFKHLPINQPKGVKGCPMWSNGGHMNFDVRNKFPHYWPSDFSNKNPDPKYMEPPLRTDGPIGYYDYPGEGSDEDYYGQCRDFLAVLKRTGEFSNLVFNIASSLEKVTEQSVLKKALTHMKNIDPDFGSQIETMVNDRLSGKAPRTEAELLVDQLNKFLKIGNSASLPSSTISPISH